VEQFLFLLLNLRRGRWQILYGFQRNLVNAMHVPMQQIAATDTPSADLDRLAKLYHMNVGVRNRQASREQLEPKRLDAGNIADGPVGHVCHAIVARQIRACTSPNIAPVPA
jgi:hypothetical protein